MFLYEQIETFRQFGSVAEMPAYMPINLKDEFELRLYQVTAFEIFVTYCENEKMCCEPPQTLFHMATGLGETPIMDGLMLYLYQKLYMNHHYVFSSNSVERICYGYIL